MQKPELARFKALLEAKQAQLSNAMRHRDEIAVQKTADLIEEVQLAAERDMAIGNLNRESGVLRSVNVALQRIARGTYGICLHCEEEINPKRLAALPWAAYCVTCQEAADRQQLEEKSEDRVQNLGEAA
jgi:RNA polymerase-binding transcription factor